MDKYIAQLGMMRSWYKISVKNAFYRCNGRWADNINMDDKEMG